MLGGLGSRRTAIAVLVAATVAIAAGIGLAARSMVSSDEGEGVVDLANITTVPFPGYPTNVTNEPPDFTKVPTCQAPESQRPNPDLPPLSCRRSDTEPPAGAIETPSPDDVPDPTAVAERAPEGWMVIDNRFFRYTLATPASWYSDMRPEGGAFQVLDEIAAARAAMNGDSGLRGGVSGRFTARALVTDYLPGFVPDVEEHLQNPNARFGSIPGAIWEGATGPGLAITIQGAFEVDGVVFEIRFNVVDAGRDADAISADAALVRAVLATIQPY